MNKKNCWEIMNCGLEPSGKNTEKYGICPVAQACIDKKEPAGRSCWQEEDALCSCIYPQLTKDGRDPCCCCPFLEKVCQEEGENFKFQDSPSEIFFKHFQKKMGNLK